MCYHAQYMRVTQTIPFGLQCLRFPVRQKGWLIECKMCSDRSPNVLKEYEKAGLVQDIGLRNPLLSTLLPRQARARIAALWALDAELAKVLAHARDPYLRLMRFTWWRDQLAALVRHSGPAPHPVLQELAMYGGARELPLYSHIKLEELADIWADCNAHDETGLNQFGVARGTWLFSATTYLLTGDQQLQSRSEAGGRWGEIDALLRFGQKPYRDELLTEAAHGPRPFLCLRQTVALDAALALAFKRARARGRWRPLQEQALLFRFGLIGR